ncbi:MAG: hypothetical protein OMM_03166 [Candidatus Magnetoglobus multicellularis str. Araruama]|uniref:PKD domain-containing protein n=1 Tax=Candidatus Magnetoglobus multicellularis str. Araruama TaxID=890399 RepID=A0A1V1P6W0_9BACT|nr:MAG: hypothetical protein OMM_03166 [Candidatus Magnetoglobus multicellularis str. Araruama]
MEVSDGTLDDTAQVTIDLNDVNEAPVMSAIDNQEIFEDHPTPSIIINLSDEDTDDLEITVETSDSTALPSSSLTFTDEGGHQNGGYTCSGENDIDISLVILPPLNVNGVFDITLTVSDSELEDTVRFSLSITPVNDMPLFTIAKTLTANEDDPTQFIENFITGISAGAADETEPLTFNMTTENVEIFNADPYLEISGTTAEIVFTPAENDYGVALVTISLTDGYSTTANRTFAITINELNDPPSFTAGGNQVVVGNTGNVQVVENWATNIYLGPPDEEAKQSATFIVEAQKDELFASGPIVTDVTEKGGTLKYTPIEKAYGVSVIEVTLSDGGDDNNAAETSKMYTFTIDISSVNDPPSFTKGNDITVEEDSNYTCIADWATDITPGHQDEMEQSIEFSITATNAGIFSVPPAIQYTQGETTADLVFTTESNANGTATLFITMKDSGGTVDGGSDTYTVQTVTITITPVNDKPSFVKGKDLKVKADNQLRTEENWATEIKAGPGNEDQTVSFSLSADPDIFSTDPAIDNSGTLTYRPSAITGTSTVTVTLTDGDGAFTSTTFIIETTATAPPTISAIADQHLAQDTLSNQIPFKISYDANLADSVQLTATSTDQTLIPDNYIIIEGTETNRTVSLSPTTGQFGDAIITIEFSDGISTVSESFALTVYERPEATIDVAGPYSATNGTVPLSVQFTPTIKSNASEITGWYWEFGDGFISDKQTPLHTYVLADEGDVSYYTVTLTVSGLGGSSTVTEASYITVNALKYVDFTATSTSGVFPLTVYFTDTSVNVDGTQQWDFGDGSTDASGASSISHIYNEPGLYTVTLNIGAYEPKVETALVNAYGLTISGTVTGEGGNIENVMVDVHSSRNLLLGSAVTNDQGEYAITDLPAASGLIVSAWPAYTMTEYMYQYYNGKETRASATPVSTLDEEPINFVLANAPKNAIKGRVVDVNTNGLPNLVVEAYSKSLDFYKSTISDEDGYYTLTALKSGTDYVVSVFDDRFATDFYFNTDNNIVTSRASATPLTPTDPALENKKLRLV